MSDRKKTSGATGKPERSSKAQGTPSKTRGTKWGRVLRTAYDDALREPVPDEFLNLLGKLD